MQPIARRIIQEIRKAKKPLDAAIKWNQLTFAKDGDFHHWICALRISKRCVTLSFHFGGLLDDARGVLRAGTSRFLRTLVFATVQEVDEAPIESYVAQAIKKLPYFIENWQAIQQEHKAEQVRSKSR